MPIAATVDVVPEGDDVRGGVRVGFRVHVRTREAVAHLEATERVVDRELEIAVQPGSECIGSRTEQGAGRGRTAVEGKCAIRVQGGGTLLGTQ
jgi:hypothetical protein